MQTYKSIGWRQRLWEWCILIKKRFTFLLEKRFLCPNDSSRNMESKKKPVFFKTALFNRHGKDLPNSYVVFHLVQSEETFSSLTMFLDKSSAQNTMSNTIPSLFLNIMVWAQRDAEGGLKRRGKGGSVWSASFAEDGGVFQLRREHILQLGIPGWKLHGTDFWDPSFRNY